MKRVLPIVIGVLFLASMFVVPTGVVNIPARLQETQFDGVTHEQDVEPSWLPLDKTVRVAIYDEANVTTPDYAYGFMNEDTTGIFDLLDNAGYQVTLLDFQEIMDHELITSNFDVFVLADNCPRENITDLVREF
ncbi:MAG: hypothetical protein ACTSUB_00305, partial [Candidatus Thorarchaeota archaeon]